MKRATRTLLMILIAIFIFSGTNYAAAPPSVTASAAIALDYSTGEVLYAKDIDTMRVPASMTKIMTAYIIYEELEKGTITKDTPFTISANARAISSNSSYPQPVPLVGSTVTVGKLLDLIMVPSASASCIVAAENISGSETAFVNRMNATAKAMGIQTAYQNCHGARPHYVTARSVAVLIQNFIKKYPDILNYTSKTSISYNGRSYSNTNKLLPGGAYAYSGADGFKTGTITQSGYCLSATAQRNGRRVITVVMNSSSTATRHTDSQKLLDYGFAEITAKDAARNSAAVTLKTNHPLRINADMKVYAVFSNVPTTFEDTFTLTVDGKTVGTLRSNIANGSTIGFTIHLDESYVGKETVEAVLSYTLPNGTVRSFKANLAVSNEPPAVFRDTAYHWAEKDIDALYATGGINGYPDRTFQPDNDITRGEFATMIAKNFDLSEMEAETSVTFNDIEGHWAQAMIEELSDAGIVFGYNGAFRPNDKITRQEATVMLSRILDLSSFAAEKTDFIDNADIAPWAIKDVSAMTKAGIIQGYEDFSFRPNTMITRAAAASIIYRVIQSDLTLR